MLESVCIAFPGIMSAFLVEKLMRQKLELRDLAAVMVGNILLINFFVFAILTGLCHGGNFTLYYAPDQIRADIAMKFLLISVVFALILSVAETFLAKHFELEFGEKPEDEKK